MAKTMTSTVKLSVYLGQIVTQEDASCITTLTITVVVVVADSVDAVEVVDLLAAAYLINSSDVSRGGLDI